MNTSKNIVCQDCQKVTNGDCRKHSYSGTKNVSQGWQCPICGCVWNWFQKGCDYCNSAAATRSPQTKDAGSTEEMAQQVIDPYATEHL